MHMHFLQNKALFTLIYLKSKSGVNVSCEAFQFDCGLSSQTKSINILVQVWYCDTLKKKTKIAWLNWAGRVWKKISNFRHVLFYFLIKIAYWENLVWNTFTVSLGGFIGWINMFWGFFITSLYFSMAFFSLTFLSHCTYYCYFHQSQRQQLFMH